MARKSKIDQVREEMSKGSNTKTVKTRRKRKPMTDEQKAAAVDRLAKARAKKQVSQGSPKGVDPEVLALPDDGSLSLKNVRQWIKTQNELLSSARADLRANIKGAEARVASHQAYIRNLDRYIRDGVYCDMFYGEHQQNKVRLICVAPSYDKDGNVKRTYGVFYSDIGGTWIGNGKMEMNGEIVDVDNS